MGLKFDQSSPELRDNIVQFYSNLSLPIKSKTDRAQRVLIARNLSKAASGGKNVLALLLTRASTAATLPLCSVQKLARC